MTSFNTPPNDAEMSRYADTRLAEIERRRLPLGDTDDDFWIVQGIVTVNYGVLFEHIAFTPVAYPGEPSIQLTGATTAERFFTYSEFVVPVFLGWDMTNGLYSGAEIGLVLLNQDINAPIGQTYPFAVHPGPSAAGVSQPPFSVRYTVMGFV